MAAAPFRRTTDQLRADAQVIRQPSGRVPVLVFVNNPFAGYAPATIEQLRQLLPGTDQAG